MISSTTSDTPPTRAKYPLDLTTGMVTVPLPAVALPGARGPLGPAMFEKWTVGARPLDDCGSAELIPGAPTDRTEATAGAKLSGVFADNEEAICCANAPALWGRASRFFSKA